jgi:hypothetical protein
MAAGMQLHQVNGPRKAAEIPAGCLNTHVLSPWYALFTYWTFQHVRNLDNVSVRLPSLLMRRSGSN